MFSSELLSLGFEVIPSQTNFVLVRFSDTRQATNAHAALESEGVYARRLAGGGFAECVRFTMGTEEEMRRCVAVLTEWVKRDE
jgi:histidinol-phosphate aminotransferase